MLSVINLILIELAQQLHGSDHDKSVATAINNQEFWPAHKKLDKV